jgi:adenylosuccinate lyase
MHASCSITCSSPSIVDEARMRANLESTRGLVCSQAVLLALVERGHDRDDAYRIVQRNAMRAWDDGTHLRELLAADPGCDLEATVLSACFETSRFLANADVVFERLRRLAV